MFTSKLSNARLYRRACNFSTPYTRAVMQSTINSYSSKTPENPDAPLPFSKSKAATWSAKTFRVEQDDTPWYQSLSISASLGAILIWFCILREENDMDKELGKSLYDRVDGLEKKQLELALKNSNGIDVDTIAIRKRLAELNLEKK